MSSSDWWEDTPENERALAGEMLVIHAAEQITVALEHARVRKTDLARRLGITRAALSQRISGRRNLTLRSLAEMAHELDCDVQLELKPRRTAAAGVINMAPQTYGSARPGNVTYEQRSSLARVVGA